MPIGNKFSSAFRQLQISGHTYLADDFTRAKSMEVSDVDLIKGTILTQVLDIGGVVEKYTVEVPILVGGGKPLDGRTLLTTKINEIITQTFTLPILERGNINVSKGGCKASITMISDGIINPSVFSVLGEVDPSTSVLNPANSANIPTRVAKWYDFRIGIGRYQLWLEQLSLDVNVKTENLYFFNGPGAFSGSTDLPSSNTYNFGTQFPWIMVKSVGITGSGTAAVEIDTGNTDVGYGDYNSVNEALNVSLGANEQSELTLQRPGRVMWEPTDFTMEIFQPSDSVPASENENTTGAWIPLFTLDGTNSIIDFSKCVIKKADFHMKAADKMTVNFEFHCWVGQPY